VKIRIKISWKAGDISAILNNTPTTEALIKSLPIESYANTWGDEVYFSVPVSVPLEKDAKQVVDPGAICFWVEGNSLALPFGPTPISEDNECRLATACNILGKIEKEPRILSSIQSGDQIKIEKEIV
tara:strand:+ start:2246 stop:2626 length:381 start_codon:yes stop_codon:yes gene_type:complete